MAPGRCGSNFKNVISQIISWIEFMGTSSENAFMWMPQNTYDGKSKLVQVMTWWEQQAINVMLT